MGAHVPAEMEQAEKDEAPPPKKKGRRRGWMTVPEDRVGAVEAEGGGSGDEAPERGPSQPTAFQAMSARLDRAVDQAFEKTAQLELPFGTQAASPASLEIVREKEQAASEEVIPITIAAEEKEPESGPEAAEGQAAAEEGPAEPKDEVEEEETAESVELPESELEEITSQDERDSRAVSGSVEAVYKAFGGSAEAAERSDGLSAESARDTIKVDPALIGQSQAPQPPPVPPDLEASGSAADQQADEIEEIEVDLDSAEEASPGEPRSAGPPPVPADSGKRARQGEEVKEGPAGGDASKSPEGAAGQSEGEVKEGRVPPPVPESAASSASPPPVPSQEARSGPPPVPEKPAESSQEASEQAAPEPATKAVPPPVPEAPRPGSVEAEGEQPSPKAKGKPAKKRKKKKKRRKKPWYEDFFDDDFLLTLSHETPEATLKEVSFIERELEISEGDRILDLGCGYGRHAVELAAKGHDVVGLDNSLPMLIRAAELSERTGVEVNFMHGDMKEMTFEEEFDAIYCFTTSFGYFDDEANREVVKRVYRALKPGGHFLLEVVNRDYLLDDLPLRVWWEGDECLVMEEVEFNYFTSRVESNRSVVFNDGRQVDRKLSIRVYSLHELGKLLHEVGFVVRQVTGNIATAGRFFGLHSPQLIIKVDRAK
jgi:SAM-dependent methyltransferase